MIRLALIGIASATAVPVVSAQGTVAPVDSGSAARVPGPVKDGGTYHLASGTWTRARNSVAAFGINDNIYSNTSPSGYYHTDISPIGPAPGGQVIDAAVIPGTTNPATFTMGGAVRDDNTVTEVQIGYCDFEPMAASAGWTLDFYETYAPCTYPPPPAQQTITVTGLPSGGCWFVNLDLVGSGQTFDIQADGGALAPGYDGSLALDSFGLGFQYAGTGSGTFNAGFLITGDPANTDTGWLTGSPISGSNTYFGEAGGCPGTGSGFENGDSFWIEDLPGTGTLGVGSNCYWFLGYNNTGTPCGGVLAGLYSGFWFELSAEGSTNPAISTPVCVGAVNATGAPGTFEVFGDAVAANNNAVLTAGNLPINEFGIFITGLDTIAPNTVFSGNGYVCINPTTQGGLGRFAAANQIKNSGAGGVITLDTNAGEWNLGSIPTSTGVYAAMMGVTSNFQAWHREQVGAGFNFTSAAAVTWQ